jgi:hypothetical protein
VGDGARPIIKSVKVNSAQKDAGRIYFIKYTPAFFTWAVKDYDDRRARLDLSTIHISGSHS